MMSQISWNNRTFFLREKLILLKTSWGQQNWLCSGGRRAFERIVHLKLARVGNGDDLALKQTNHDFQ